MFVTFSQLVRELQRSISVQAYNVSDRQIITEIALLPTRYAPGSPPLRQDAVYICEFWQLKQFEPGYQLAPIICVVEPNADPPSVFFTNRPIAVVYGSSLLDTMLTLSNASYNLGCKSSLITEVSHSLLQCKNITELMEEGFRALKNPILITDQDQKILYYTDPDLISTPDYRQFIVSEYLPVGHPDPATLSPAWTTPEVPFVTVGNENMFPVCCKALSVGDNIIGYLHVVQFHQPLDEQDINLTELLGNLLTVELWQNKKNEPRDKQGQLQRFIRDILDNQLGTPEEASLRQKQLGLTFKPFLYAAAFNLRRADPVNRILFSELAATVSTLIPNCHSLLYRNSVFALIESDTEIFDLKTYLSPLIPILEKYGLICGASNLFHSVFDLRNYGYQATKAIQLGSVLSADRCLYLYQEYTIDYMMEMCLNRESTEALFPPAFLRLRRHCEQNGNTLMETLDTYLNCGRNKSDTAKALFVHLNTVKYRIAQIQEIMSVDLDDDSTVLNLMLAFRMLRHHEKFPETCPN